MSNMALCIDVKVQKHSVKTGILEGNCSVWRANVYIFVVWGLSFWQHC